MAYTEVEEESWMSKLMSSIKSVGAGLGMFVLAFPLLFWNEGRAVQTAKSLTEGAGAVVSVPSDKVNPANEAKLVHTSGEARTEEVLEDSQFGVKENAIQLVRKVEMYQWKEKKRTETKKKVGGKSEKVTTYDYEKVWSEELIDSDGFKEKKQHWNPEDMLYSSQQLIAKKVTLGAFTVPASKVEKIGPRTELPASKATLKGVPERTHVQEKSIFLGRNPSAPAVGDVRVSFSVVKPGPISLIGKQTGSTFSTFQTEAGDSLLLLSNGTQTAQEMFTAAQSANATMTWFLRIFGCLIMAAGLSMVFKPIAVLGDVVPVVGSLLEAGLGLFAFLISMALSFATIGVAWLVYRPVLGVGLLVVSVGASVGLVALAKKRRAAKQSSPATAGGPRLAA